jgi:porin
MTLKKSTTLAALLTLNSFCGAYADDYSPDKFLLGDWGGKRTELHEQGVDFLFTYVNELAYNTQGGERHKGTYADQLMFDSNLDLQKILGWQGAQLHMTITNRNGENLNTEAGLDTLLNQQEIYGYGSVTRLAQLYYQQSLFDGKATLKVGRLPMSGDIFPFSCKFQNLTFCGTVPGYITPNWFTWPVSQWGGVFTADVTHEVYVQTSLYQVNPRFTENSQGLNLGSPTGTTGYMAVLEAGWKPTLQGLPGAYRIGAWHNTGDFDDMYRDRNGQPIGLTGAPAHVNGDATGFYVMAQQQVFRDPANEGRGLSLFANFIKSDRDVSYVERAWQAGLFLSAPFDARPDDEVGLAVGGLEVNSHSARRVREANSMLSAGIAGQPIPHTEYPAELYYAMAVTPAVTVRPNVQYVKSPGGLSDDTDVVVFGLKTVISF